MQYRLYKVFLRIFQIIWSPVFVAVDEDNGVNPTPATKSHKR